MIRRKSADTRQVVAKRFVAKQDLRGEDSQDDARSAMHDERHHEGLESSEVIGNNNTAAHGQLIGEAMESDTDIEAAFQASEDK